MNEPRQMTEIEERVWSEEMKAAFRRTQDASEETRTLMARGLGIVLHEQAIRVQTNAQRDRGDKSEAA
jgi:hypothetical protein